MKVAIHQPDYIPYLGFFYKMYKSDLFIYLDDAQFSNEAAHNFNKIKTPQGVLRVKFPVEMKFGDPINHVRPKDELKWKEKHLKTIEMNYKKAPFFSDIYPSLKEVYLNDYSNVADLNIALNTFISNQFGIKPKIFRSSELLSHAKKEERVIDLSLEVGATAYISGNGARVYQDESHFNERGLKLEYMDYSPIEYPQLWGDFIENMEIGSFLELDLRDTGELFNGSEVCRLNLNRAGIYHCCRLLNVNKVLLPYYECFTVRNFLLGKGFKVDYYHIDKDFMPLDISQDDDTAIVFVNYFGLMSTEHMLSLIEGYKNVIIDNAQSLFAKPINGVYNVYSPRKFVGVPDGCYVVGPDAVRFSDEYDQDLSSETAGFLLQRIEVGCNSAYQYRQLNEKRIDMSNISRMSILSRAILKNAPYDYIKNKRFENFNLASDLYSSMNKINPHIYFDDNCVPFVYPLVVEKSDMVDLLSKEKIYTGRWWNYLLKETDSTSFEYYLSSYMIPIPIDQRYGKNEIEYVYNIINKYLTK